MRSPREAGGLGPVLLTQPLRSHVRLGQAVTLACQRDAEPRSEARRIARPRQAVHHLDGVVAIVVRRIQRSEPVGQG